MGARALLLLALTALAPVAARAEDKLKIGLIDTLSSPATAGPELLEGVIVKDLADAHVGACRLR